VHCVARLDAGKDPLHVVFTPTGGRALAVPAPATRILEVARAQTTVVLNVPTRARPNAKVTYSASVESTSGETPSSGGVVFEDRGHPIAGCQLQPIKDGTATCSLSYALSGRHVITAHFVAGGNFAASTSGPTPERIAEPRAVGAITATINWTFHFTPHFTSINALVLHGAVAGSTLTMRCAGKGCPFHARRLRIRHAAAAVNLDRDLHGQHLGIHAKVVITITRPRFVGKYYRFTIRPRKAPKIVIDCLALGSHTPGAGCTSS
jgi:Bacterial Ig-like domain (group 3)